MTEEVQAKILEWIESGAVAVGEKLPQVAEEIVAYGFYSNLFGWVISLGIVLASIKLFMWIIKSDDIDESCAMFPVISFSISIIFFFVCFHSFLQAWLSPTLYIIGVLK